MPRLPKRSKHCRQAADIFADNCRKRKFEAIITTEPKSTSNSTQSSSSIPSPMFSESLQQSPVPPSFSQLSSSPFSPQLSFETLNMELMKEASELYSFLKSTFGTLASTKENIIPNLKSQERTDLMKESRLFQILIPVVQSQNYLERKRKLENDLFKINRVQEIISLQSDDFNLGLLLLSYNFESLEEFLTFQSSTAILKEKIACEEKSQVIFITNIIEILIQKRSNGSFISPAAIENSIFPLLSKGSESFFDFMNQRGMTCSYKKAREIIENMISCFYDEMIADLLKAANDPRLQILLMIDNMNPPQCRKHFNNNNKFTSAVPSTSIIWFPIPINASTTSNPANKNFVYKNLAQNALSGISVPEEFKNINDLNYSKRSVKSFNIFPNLDVRSSSTDEIYEFIINGFLVKLCNLLTKEIILVVDPEFILIFENYHTGSLIFLRI
jgi:hypothetical protein